MDNVIIDDTQQDIEEFLQLLNTYKEIKMTMFNAEEIIQILSDRIHLEPSLKNVMLIEEECLNKLNDIHEVVTMDNFEMTSEMLADFIPTIIKIVSFICTSLTMTTCEKNKKSFNTVAITGEDGIVTQLTTRLKRSTLKTCKTDFDEVLKVLKKCLSDDIRINKRLRSFGIKSRQELQRCTVKIIKNGGIEIHKK